MLIAYDTVHDTSDIHSETNVRFSENFKFFTAGQKSEKNQPYKSFFFPNFGRITKYWNSY